MSDLPTGYKQFDTLTGGLQHIDVLMAVTSPSSAGISLALSIALNVATTSQRSVGFFSLAMNKVQVTQCLLAMHAGIDRHRLRAEQLKDDEWQWVTVAARELSRINLWIDDPSHLCAADLRQQARQLVDAHRVSLECGPAPWMPLSRGNGRRLARCAIACTRWRMNQASQFWRALRWPSLYSFLGVKLHSHTTCLAGLEQGARDTSSFSRGESSQSTRTRIFTIFMTQERSGLVAELVLFNRRGALFL